MIVGITGASSGIGQAVVDAVRQSGHTPIALGRSRAEHERSYDLTSAVNPEILDGLGAVIHLAWAWGEPVATNVRAGEELAAACNTVGARPVLLSTFSAFAHATSEYGAAKMRVENAFAEAGGVSLRSGLIWGSGQPSGMIAVLRRLAGLPLVAPRLMPDPLMFHSHEASLANVLVAAASDPGQPPTTLAASREGVRLSRLMARLRSEGIALPVPVPVRGLSAVARVLERWRVPLPFRADSLATVRPDIEDWIAESPIQWGGTFPGTEDLLSWAVSLPRHN